MNGLKPIEYSVVIAFIALVGCTGPKPASEEQSPATSEPTEQQAQMPLSSSDTEDVVSTFGRLPKGWPDSIPIMDGFSVGLGGRAHNGKLLHVYATGKVDRAEAMDFYTSLDGWQRDYAGPWITEGEFIEGRMVDESGNKLDIAIFSEGGESELDLWYEIAEPSDSE